MGTTDNLNIKKFILAVLSGFLLTGSFPKFGIYWFAWFALVPLLVSLRNLSPRNSFFLGLLTGFVHYCTLLYWLIYAMNWYGNLPVYLSLFVLFVFSLILAFFPATFSLGLTRFSSGSLIFIFFIPLLWVSLEYIRSFLFSGFPWELIGYSQYKQLHLIQISDIFGVYGVSFAVVFANAFIFLLILKFTGLKWQDQTVNKTEAALLFLAFVLIAGFIWFYGKSRIKFIDELASASPKVSVSIVQGNISQSIKWDPAFQVSTTKKYINLSLSTKADKPDLIVWPETSAPFYFLYNEILSKMVLQAACDTGSDFLVGSPYFIRENKIINYYNSAYLIGSGGNVLDRYDKTHLVPFGEYVPLKKWFPFFGKIVSHVGDFKEGKKGHTINWRNYKLGVQICYEIIFPSLSRKMVENNASLLLNITNDAWYGMSSAPYQHFSMAVFRAVENRRSLVRSANTGISGFVDPVGRIIASTPLFEEKIMTRLVPVILEKSIYTHSNDFFALVCLIAALLVMFFSGISRLKFKDAS